MKKLLALILLLCTIFPLAACGSKNNDSSSSGVQGTSDEKTYEMVVSHDEIIDSPIHRGLEAFKKYVETESNGRITVKLYANGELGDAETSVDMISRGSVQVTNCNSDILSSYNDKLTFLCLPFLFDDYEQAYAVACDPEGTLHKLYQEEANKVGFYVLGFPYLGARALTNNVREVTTADDLKGLKMRVKNSDMSVATFTALGCNVTPLAYSEVYTALQQNVVNGQDNPAANVVNMKFMDVQKYYSTLGHDMNISLTVCDYDWLMSLPDDLREIVITGGELYGGKQISEETFAQEQKDLEAIEAAGCKVTTITDKSSFIEATQTVYDQFRSIYGDEFMDTVLKAVGKA